MEHWDDSGTWATVKFNLEYFWQFTLRRWWDWLRYWAIAALVPLLLLLSGWMMIWRPAGMPRSLLLVVLWLLMAGVAGGYIYWRDWRSPQASSMTMRCPGCHQIRSGRLRGQSNWWTCPRCHYRARFTIYG